MGRVAGTRFVAIPMWILDAQISDRALRLYAVLQSYMNGRDGGVAWPSRQTLATRLGCSRDSVDRAIHELEDLGALQVQNRVRETENKRGERTTAYLSNNYLLAADQPDHLAAPTRLPSRTHAATPGGTHAARGSRTHAALDLDPVLDLDPSPRPNELEGALPPASGSDDDPFFRAFWSVYPRNDDKGGARRAWRSAIKKAEPTLVVEGAQRYARDPNLPERQFIPHASTWLNGERWQDGPLPPRARQAAGATTQRSAQQKIVDRLKEGMA